MTKDYRCTNYCKQFEELDSKKSSLENLILNTHPDAKDMHNFVNLRFKKNFMTMYNDKCGYCGTSLDNINVALFEIDHFIPHSCKSEFENKTQAGFMGNLVLSCNDCNRAKSSYLINKKSRHLLHPDSPKTKEVYTRDNEYYIRVSNNYIGNADVVDFYNICKLNYQTRRIDYALSVLRGITAKNKDYKEILLPLLVSLQQKRNSINCTMEINILQNT